MDLAAYKALSFDCYGTGETLGRPVGDAWARRLGDSVPDWPAFPDSAAALASLSTHSALVFDMLADLGIARAELLHVAQSLFHDHVPARLGRHPRTVRGLEL
jgi:2-haloacid dehalogenase